MINRLFPLLFLAALYGCGNNTIPDVSKVDAKVEVERFDRSFFAVDPNRLDEGLTQVRQEHPTFNVDFMQHVLGLPADDTSSDSRNNLLFFFEGYRPLYDTLMRTYDAVDDIQRSVKEGLQFARYYFPAYPTNKKLIFFVGPFDSPGTALTREGIAVGLHQYAGKDFSFYLSPQGMELFPTYISRRFDRPYIAVNCLKLIVQDIAPDTARFGSLIDRMIRRGREAWLLDRFLPHTADSLKMGYTADQLKWCEKNESMIWSYFLKNIDLQSNDPELLQNFLGEGPFTVGLDQERSPGNLGTWVGRQIVRAYMEKFPNTTPEALIWTAPQKILEKAGYKPR
jgi:hypothetical protein